MNDENKMITAILIFAILLWLPLTYACVNEIMHPIKNNENQTRSETQEIVFLKSSCEQGNNKESCDKLNDFKEVYDLKWNK